MTKNCFVILNDGETYTGMEGCVIYDANTDSLYSIRKDREIDVKRKGMHWEKGVSEIHREEYDNEDNGILGK